MRDEHQDCERQDDAAAYALDALTEEERPDFEAHLAQCPGCRALVDDLRGAAAELSDGLETEPPPELRAQVLAAIAHEEQLSASAVPGEGGADVVSLDERRARPGSRSRTWWPLAAAAAAVIAVGGTFLLWPEDPEDAVLQAADAQVYSETVDGAVIEVYYSAELDQAVLTASDLPPAPEGRDLQVWYIDADGAARSAGLVPRGEGEDVEMLLTGPSFGVAEAVAISEEPAGGSPAPTTEPGVAIPIEG